VSDDKYAPAASGMAPVRGERGAHDGTAFARADGDRAAIVAINDLVSEVGW
jgi:hypothetical protein